MEKKLFVNKLLLYSIFSFLFSCKETNTINKTIILNDDLKKNTISFINKSKNISKGKDIIIEVLKINNDTIFRFIKTKPYTCNGYVGMIKIKNWSLYIYYYNGIKNLSNIKITNRHNNCDEFVIKRNIDLPYEEYYVFKNNTLTPASGSF